MSDAVDDILNSLDINQLAETVGAQPAEVEQAAAAALPALFGGLEANAQDPAGASSLLEALNQHDPSLLDGGVDVSQIDTNDGAAIASHIFGINTDAVYNQLGQYGAAGGMGGTLFKRLLPILAPIVLSYVMKQMTQRTGGGAGSGSGGGGMGDILGQVLGGGGAAQQTQDTQLDADALPQRTDAPQQAPTAGQGGLDSILKDVLGGAAASTGSRTQQQPQQSSGGGILGDLLGGLLGGGRR